MSTVEREEIVLVNSSFVVVSALVLAAVRQSSHSVLGSIFMAACSDIYWQRNGARGGKREKRQGSTSTAAGDA